jgi:hypothetical protein
MDSQDKIEAKQRELANWEKELSDRRARFPIWDTEQNAAERDAQKSLSTQQTMVDNLSYGKSAKINAIPPMQPAEPFSQWVVTFDPKRMDERGKLACPSGRTVECSYDARLMSSSSPSYLIWAEFKAFMAGRMCRYILISNSDTQKSSLHALFMQGAELKIELVTGAGQEFVMQLGNEQVKLVVTECEFTTAGYAGKNMRCFSKLTVAFRA